MNSSMSPTAATVASPPSFQSISSSNLNTNTKPLTQEPYDLLCVGFGPASLAIAVALHDLEINARVLFIERQPQFAWHSGMLLPTARMQISFLKDLATFRDPRSRFTFLNYLKEKDRLEAFTNLSTFLPFREEFNDYLTWAASHFDEYVRYSTEVVAIVPASEGGNPVQTWNVISRDTQTHDTLSFSAKNVIIAVGGQPKLPRVLQGIGENVVHSSQYLRAVPHKLPLSKPNARVAVVGGGQSAAEIFDDLTSRFPQLNTTLYTTQFALKPSDDSPFINEIFDPNRVDEFYNLPDSARSKSINENKATNYSVVRLELLDRLYEKLYHHRLHSADPTSWPHRIVGLHELTSATTTSDGKISLKFKNPRGGKVEQDEKGFDLVIVGTGYVRNSHERMLRPVKELFEGGYNDVTRGYQLKLKEGVVKEGTGIWLQGCCEGSHGLSDTLLSILAVRGGEIVESIFGKQQVKNTPARSPKKSSPRGGRDGVEERVAFMAKL